MANLDNADFPQPRIDSYDSGYEHSLEHYVEVRQLFEEADQGFVFGDRLSYNCVEPAA